VKRVALTGASGGIGRETALRLARREARLALIARSAGRLQEMADALGDGNVAITADLGVRSEAERAVQEAAAEFDGLDVLISNAAAAAYGPFSDVPPDAFERTLDVSLFGAINSVRAALPHLERSDGSIVIVGSIVRDASIPLFTSYVTAKAGLRAFADSLRAELAASGSSVTISMVEPGPVDTLFWRRASSFTGEQPVAPVGAIDPVKVATKVEKRVFEPKARSVVGPYALAQRAAARAAPRIADRVLPLAQRIFSATATPARGRGALWQSSEEADAEASRGDD
jgi:short-subunit dehydrogenase